MRRATGEELSVVQTASTASVGVPHVKPPNAVQTSPRSWQLGSDRQVREVERRRREALGLQSECRPDLLHQLARGHRADLRQVPAGRQPVRHEHGAVSHSYRIIAVLSFSLQLFCSQIQSVSPHRRVSPQARDARGETEREGPGGDHMEDRGREETEALQGVCHEST